MTCLLVGNQLPAISASSFVLLPPRPNIAAASRVILDFLVAFAILFAAIDAHPIQLSMLYCLSFRRVQVTILFHYWKPI